MQIKAILWNLRGGGDSIKLVYLKKIIRREKPVVILLQETKLGIINDQMTSSLGLCGAAFTVNGVLSGPVENREGY